MRELRDWTEPGPGFSRNPLQHRSRSDQRRHYTADQPVKSPRRNTYGYRPQEVFPLQQAQQVFAVNVYYNLTTRLEKAYENVKGPGGIRRMLQDAEAKDPVKGARP